LCYRTYVSSITFELKLSPDALQQRLMYIDTTISASRVKLGKLSDAVEYAGRALLIRMKQLGLVNEETADSHYNLGQIYRFLGDYQQSRKELRICKQDIGAQIYRSFLMASSVQVAALE
jgi:tetratricopeptide (TPR) repeat protein